MKLGTVAVMLLVAFSLQKASAADDEKQQPRWFGWIYNAQPEPGNRVWIRDGVIWSEQYPSGFIKTLRVVGRTSLKGIEGTVVHEIGTSTLEVFIPDLRSKQMFLYFRHGNGDWQLLGVMIGPE